MQCIKPILIKPFKDKPTFLDNKLCQVPCGRCMPCRLNRAKEWSVRLALEMKEWPVNSFVTLTYDNEHYPEDFSKRHVQLFLKRLRKKYSDQTIRYYAVGELGSITKRMHYHILLFNYFPDDITMLKQTKYGDLYKSQELRDLWGMGHVSVSRMSQMTINYVTAYITEKYDYVNPDTGEVVVNGFALMSRRPGIGAAYLERNASSLRELENFSLNGKVHSLPRFYKNKLKDNEINYRAMAARIDAAERVQKLILNQKITMLGVSPEQLKRDELESLIIKHKQKQQQKQI